MSIQFRNYTKQAGITEDYHKVRNFFIRLGYVEFTYTRWDWMTTHGYLDRSAVGKTGLWEDEGKIVGVATFDCQLGEAFCLALPEYAFLKKEMLIYAKDNLSKDGKFGVVIADTDLRFQDIAADLGFKATEEKENDAIFYVDKTSTKYNLPDGFYITTMKETFDLYQYLRVLWKGFNHELNGEGEFQFTKEKEILSNAEMLRPNVDLNLKVAAVAPDGNFAAYCGMWYDPQAGYAVIEPVATDPKYRKMGLGRAVVLEGISRVGELGAKTALVGSMQQFYYSIGLRPYKTATIWREK
ncbi:GNAT family N-acetyltransferase [Clostridium chromiireducens]|uniref:Acetyltransferase (GNAT) family protein n=1 Tax=Clostridium chromiireducens TaxID=225345 RepID=A0A1V4IS36_9CLOT|nr:GNAT family N-acetyltransferase [Clostridium chromiireducens]OPJ62832.1 acetyltransferase (GNAT) family protein [Clostridium chromiireducens]